MAIKEIEVKTVLLKAYCDKCPGIELYATGAAQMTMPPKYYHKCSRCGEETLLDAKYPTIQHKY